MPSKYPVPGKPTTAFAQLVLQSKQKSIWEYLRNRGWLNTGTGFPGKLWSLHSWRYSKPKPDTALSHPL